MEMYRYYDLYNGDKFINSVNDIDFALHQLLSKCITHFIVYKYKYKKSQGVENGTFKIDNNKVIKIIDDKYISLYSPYDDCIFSNSELSRLYLKFYESDKISKKIITMNPVRHEIKNDIKQDIKQDIKHEIKNDIGQEIKQDKGVITEVKYDDKILAKEAEKRFNEKQKKKNDEAENNNYNIFMADVGVYNILIEEKEFTEAKIPLFFIGKYYIIKYLYANNYFVDNDISSPDRYIYLIYQELYDFMTNNYKLKDNDIDELIELKNDFLESLPDKKIQTDRQIFNMMNDNYNNDIFIEPSGYSDAEENSEDGNSNCSKLFDDESRGLIVEKIKSNITEYKDIKKYKKNIPEIFNKDYKVIEYLFSRGFFDDSDIDNSVNDYYCLYVTLLDYSNSKKIENDISEMHKDELEKFKKYII